MSTSKIQSFSPLRPRFFIFFFGCSEFGGKREVNNSKNNRDDSDVGTRGTNGLLPRLSTNGNRVIRFVTHAHSRPSDLIDGSDFHLNQTVPFHWSCSYHVSFLKAGVISGFHIPNREFLIIINF